METVVGRLVYKITGDTQQFNSSMNSTKQLITRFVSAGALVAAGKQFLTLGSNAEELGNKFNVVFKGIEKDTNAWVNKYAKDVSRGANATKTYISSLQDIRTGFGDSVEGAAEFSKAVVGITNDLSSFSNVPFEQASAAIQSGLNGQFEALRSLGIGLNVNIINQGKYAESLGKTWDQMDNLEKQEAILSGIVSQSTNAIGQSVDTWQDYNYELGDAAKTSDSYANTLQGVKGQLEDTVAGIGESFLPLASTVLTGVGTMVSGFGSLPAPIKATTVAVIGLGLAFKALNPVGALLSGVVVGATALIGVFNKQDSASGDLRESYKNLRDLGTQYKDVVEQLTDKTDDLTDAQIRQLEVEKMILRNKIKTEMAAGKVSWAKVAEDVEKTEGAMETILSVQDVINNIDISQGIAKSSDDMLTIFATMTNGIINLKEYFKNLDMTSDWNTINNHAIESAKEAGLKNLARVLRGDSSYVYRLSKQEMLLYLDYVDTASALIQSKQTELIGDLDVTARQAAEGLLDGSYTFDMVFGLSIDSTGFEQEVVKWQDRLKEMSNEVREDLLTMDLSPEDANARKTAQWIVSLVNPAEMDAELAYASDEVKKWVKIIHGDYDAINEMSTDIKPLQTGSETAVDKNSKKRTQSYIDDTKAVIVATEELGKTQQEVLNIQRQRAYDAATNTDEKQAAKELYDALDAQLKKEQEIAEEQQRADQEATLQEYKYKLKDVGKTAVEVAEAMKTRAIEQAKADGMSEDAVQGLVDYHDNQIAIVQAKEELTKAEKEHNEELAKKIELQQEIESMLQEVDTFQAGEGDHPEADRIKSMIERANELKESGEMTEETWKKVTTAYQEMLDSLHYTDKPLEDWEWDDWANAALDACGQILSEVDKLVTAIYQKQIDMQDKLLQVELEARGLLEEEEDNKYTKQRQDATKALIDLQANIKKETNIEKKQEMEKQSSQKAIALDKLKQEEHDEEQRLAIKKKYEQEKAQLEYKSAMWSWGIELTQATVGVARAIAQNAGNPVLAALAGIVGALQIATISMTKPQKPQFALGALEVPQDMEAIIHQGEMILPRPFAEDVRQGKIAVGGTGGSGGNSNVKVEIYTSEPVETEESQDGDMTKLKVFVGKAWLEAYSKGQFDNPLKSRHGLTKRGIR